MAVKEAVPRYRRINHPSLDERKVVGVGSVGTRAFTVLMAPITLTYYARLCGWTLARAHARTGDPVAIAEYLAGNDAFDQSITDFCEHYADQNEQDYEEFGKAVRSGRLEAVEGV